MKLLSNKFFLFSLSLIVLVCFVLFTPKVFGQTCGSVDDCSKLIGEYQSQITKLQGQANTLSNQIAQFNAQITLTSLKIKQTEEKISLLGGRIDQLEISLDDLTKAFSSRAVETYKLAKSGNTISFLLISNNLNEAVSRFHYLQVVQKEDGNFLQRLQTAQINYKSQKTDQEELQKELATEKANLNSQKASKASLLAATKNDEKKYQSLLASAQAEYAAILGIIAGKGVETEVGKVNEGQRIASIIQDASCNSDGSHLHFIVREGSNALNPFNYLKGGIDYENCSGSSCGSSDGDSFNPIGSWNWPINAKVKFTQGFGSTWATRNTWVSRIYTFHNGIDINGSNSEVKAVKSGTLYQGSYGVGCLLKYVRVDHDDSNLDTLYLHINY